MRGPKLAFWIHQVVEYALAFMLVSAGVRSAKPAFPIAAAGVVLVLAASSDGPLGAFRAFSRTLHRTFDRIVTGAFVVASIVLWSKVGTSSATVVLVAGVLLAVLGVRTNYAPKPVKEPRARRVLGGAAPATTTSGETIGSRPGGAIIGNERAEAIGRGAGKVAGKVAVTGVRAWKSRKRP